MKKMMKYMMLAKLTILSIQVDLIGQADTLSIVEGVGNSFTDVGILSKGCFIGYYSENNFFGIRVEKNSDSGIMSKDNGGNGFYSLSNDRSGLRSEDNKGHSAYLTSPASRAGAAVFIGHNEDANVDLEFGGNGRITSAEHIYLRVDSDNTSNSGKVFIQKNDGTQIAAFSESGNSAINTNLDVCGRIRASGLITSSQMSACSDLRYKKNVTPLTNSLSNLSLINGVTYDWDQELWPEKNFSDRLQIGFIAQELEEVYPELVHTDEDGYKSVAYNKMTAILVEAVKELDVENDELKLENEELKKLIRSMDARLSQLEGLGGTDE